MAYEKLSFNPKKCKVYDKTGLDEWVDFKIYPHAANRCLTITVHFC